MGENDNIQQYVKETLLPLDDQPYLAKSWLVLLKANETTAAVWPVSIECGELPPILSPASLRLPLVESNAS